MHGLVVKACSYESQDDIGLFIVVMVVLSLIVRSDRRKVVSFQDDFANSGASFNYICNFKSFPGVRISLELKFKGQLDSLNPIYCRIPSCPFWFATSFRNVLKFY